MPYRTYLDNSVVSAQQDADPAARSTAFQRARQELRTLLPTQERSAIAEDATPADPMPIALLARILQDERRQRYTFLALRIAASALGGIVAISATSAWLIEDHPGLAFLGLSILVPLLILWCHHNPISRREKAAREYLLAGDDRRRLGLLLEQRVSATPGDLARINLALIRLLPEITVEEMAQLTDAQRHLLYGTLGYEYRFYDTDLNVAVIEALGRLGDKEALNRLYSLANGQAATKREQAVRAAAQKSLYALHTGLDFGSVEAIPKYLNGLFSYSSATTQSTPYLTDAYSLYALVALLPRLSAEEYYRIVSPTERERMYGLLERAVANNYFGYEKPRLYREFVCTFERAGDTKAIQTLVHVANMDAPSDGEKQLRSAAKQALRTLRQQVEREKVGKTLLRASMAPGVQPEELLRPAGPAASTTAPSELLRAAQVSPEPAQHEPASPQARKPITADSITKTVEAMRRRSQDDAGL